MTEPYLIIVTTHENEVYMGSHADNGQFSTTVKLISNKLPLPTSFALQITTPFTEFEPISMSYLADRNPIEVTITVKTSYFMHNLMPIPIEYYAEYKERDGSIVRDYLIPVTIISGTQKFELLLVFQVNYGGKVSKDIVTFKMVIAAVLIIVLAFVIAVAIKPYIMLSMFLVP